jgi:glycosyltransferase involved in cell wall biosynthesis
MNITSGPLVSVVMVTCNVERYLREAMESVLSQTFRDFEFVIVDFGSTDKSQDIICSYASNDSRINFREITKWLGSGAECRLFSCERTLHRHSGRG